MFDLWQLHRRAVLVGACMLTGLVAVLVAVGVIAHVAGDHTSPQSERTTQPTAGANPPSGKHAASGSMSGALASDVAQWNAMPAVTPAFSAAFPAIPATARTDPAVFASAFATELFSRNYTTATAAQLASWAQAENAPLRSPKYPAKDWSKVLVDSLTDLTWDGATSTPIPANGLWLALRDTKAVDSVSQVSVRTDPQWENDITTGYQPADQLATVQDVTLTVTRHTTGTQAPVTRFSVSIAVQLGSAPSGGYGAAATNNFVERQVG